MSDQIVQVAQILKLLELDEVVRVRRKREGEPGVGTDFGEDPYERLVDGSYVEGGGELSMMNNGNPET